MEYDMMMTLFEIQVEALDILTKSMIAIRYMSMSSPCDMAMSTTSYLRITNLQQFHTFTYFKVYL